jgi:predicted Zn-dependent peptidase
VISEYIPHFRSISLGFWIPTGSRNESINISGITHLIEHLIFKGTKNRSYKDIAIEFDSLGAEFNAFTDKEECCVYVDFIDTYLEKCTELLFDILLNPSFLTEHIKTEKKVIFEEIKIVEDNPSEKAMNHFYKAVLGSHPLGFPILGSRKSLKEINKPKILDYFRDRFDISNIVISAAGNITHKQLVNVINDSLGRLYSGKKSLFQEKTGLTGLFNSDKIPENKKIKKIYNNKNKAAHICIGNLGCKRNSSDKYPLFVLTNILGGSMSSRLFQKIREEKGLAYSIYSSNAQYLDTGVIIIYAASSPANAPRITEMIKSEISSINKNGINETELDRARENIKGNIVLSVEDISSRMFRLGKGLLFDKKVLTIDAILKKIDKVGMDDVDRVAKKYLKPDNLNIIITGKSVRGRL